MVFHAVSTTPDTCPVCGGEVWKKGPQVHNIMWVTCKSKGCFSRGYMLRKDKMTWQEDLAKWPHKEKQ